MSLKLTVNFGLDKDSWVGIKQFLDEELLKIVKKEVKEHEKKYH